jgi:predicted metal-binding membrane protein
VERAARGPNAWLVPFAAVMLSAWMMLAFDGSVLSLPAFCSAGSRGMPLSVSFDLALVSNAIPQLALGWVLMVVAMMLPLAIAPLRHVRERSFASRRTRSMLLFVSGFVAVWIAVGIILEIVAWFLRWAEPVPLAGVGLAIMVALVWQVSPAKQWCLNRCHQRPPLAAFGFAADFDAFRFGARNGVACAGVCWALMLPMLLIGQGQLLMMILVTLFSFAESLENPARLAWRWRGCGKVLRIIAAWWPIWLERTSGAIFRF